MLVSGNWGPYTTFKLIPVTSTCPYVEAIYDPSGKILAVISKNIKAAYHMVPKLDDNGDQVPMKVKQRANGKNFKEQRIMMDTYQEYYITQADEITELIEAFAMNADKYDYKKIMETEVQSLEAAANPLSAEKATNLQIVE